MMYIYTQRDLMHHVATGCACVWHCYWHITGMSNQKGSSCTTLLLAVRVWQHLARQIKKDRMHTFHIATASACGISVKSKSLVHLLVGASGAQNMLTGNVGQHHSYYAILLRGVLRVSRSFLFGRLAV